MIEEVNNEEKVPNLPVSDEFKDKEEKLPVLTPKPETEATPPWHRPPGE